MGHVELVSQPRIQLAPPFIGNQRPNHWITREVPYRLLSDIIKSLTWTVATS